MDHHRWELIQALFQQAVELPESQRSTFLNAATRADQQLLTDVESLLKQDAGTGSLLDQTISLVAAPLLNPSSQLPSQEFGPY